MRTKKWVKLDELRQPGMRRMLEAMKLIEDESPGFCPNSCDRAS